MVKSLGTTSLDMDVDVDAPKPKEVIYTNDDHRYDDHPSVGDADEIS